jgi:hypothetical protein
MSSAHTQTGAVGILGLHAGEDVNMCSRTTRLSEGLTNGDSRQSVEVVAKAIVAMALADDDTPSNPTRRAHP